MKPASRWASALAGLLGATAALAAAPDPPSADVPAGPPLAVEATGLLPLENESTLTVSGIRGQVMIETRAERELRVVSRGPGDDAPEIPVGIWQSGTQLFVAPPPGDPGKERHVHIEVPYSFGIGVRGSGTEVIIVGAAGSYELRGTDLRAMVSESAGTLSADLTGGSVTLNNAGDASLRLHGTKLEVASMSGSLGVHASGGSLSLSKIGGSTDLDTEDTTIQMTAVPAALKVRARKGEAAITGLDAGAEIEMTGGSLRLKEGRGDITVTSDAIVDFVSMAASLHFDMNGGTVRGKTNQGPIDIRVRNTEVNVEGVQGALKIQGDGLRAKIEDAEGELSIESTSADVAIDRAAGVTLRLDRSSASVQRAAAVSAVINGGDVKIADVNGPVNLDQDGGNADVSWASITGDKDSKISNKSGSVTAHFPSSSYCRVEAKTSNGRVDTDIPSLKVGDDQGDASGPINNGTRPVVRIEARGDVHLMNGSGQANDEGN